MMRTEVSGRTELPRLPTTVIAPAIREVRQASRRFHTSLLLQISNELSFGMHLARPLFLRPLAELIDKLNIRKRIVRLRIRNMNIREIDLLMERRLLNADLDAIHAIQLDLIAVDDHFE